LLWVSKVTRFNGRLIFVMISLQASTHRPQPMHSS